MSFFNTFCYQLDLKILVEYTTIITSSSKLWRLHSEGGVMLFTSYSEAVNYQLPRRSLDFENNRERRTWTSSPLVLATDEDE